MQAMEDAHLNVPMKVLVDTSVLAQAVTHTTAWISKGTHSWGPHKFEAGYMARVQRDFTDPKDAFFAPEVTALVSLNEASKAGSIKFYRTMDLTFERLRQPSGRFLGYGHSDSALRLDCTPLPHHDDFVFGNEYLSKESQEERLLSRHDQPFRSILNAIGRKHVLDAWHLHSTETHGVGVFLTVDGRLLNAIRNAIDSGRFPRLHAEAMKPSTLLNSIGLQPADLRKTITNDGAFFVEPSMQAPHRRPPRRKV